MVAQVCQVLWTAAARPRYGDGPAIFIAPALLTAVSYSLNRAHQTFTTLSGYKNWREYLLFSLPVSLHFGWISAASLVNWNSSLAVFLSENNRILVVVGHYSVVAATALGAAVTLSRQAPVYGAVVSWVLCACASTMRCVSARPSFPITAAFSWRITASSCCSLASNHLPSDEVALSFFEYEPA
jgi:hypothetical protein